MDNLHRQLVMRISREILCMVGSWMGFEVEVKGVALLWFGMGERD